MTVVAWQAAIASGAFLAGTIIQGLLVLNYPDYNFERWHGTLLIWACILVAIFVNTVLSSLLPFIEGGLLFVHILGFIAIFIILVYMAPHGTAYDVFTQFYNGGNWPTQGLSTMVGLIGLVFAFVGKKKPMPLQRESILIHLQGPTQQSTCRKRFRTPISTSRDLSLSACSSTAPWALLSCSRRCSALAISRPP